MLAAGALLLLGSTAAASAQVGPTSGEIEEFDYTLTNVNPPLASPGLLFATGVSASAGGSVLVQSGSLENAEFLANSWGIVPSGTDTVNAQVTDWRIVTASTITGTANVPPGATLTVQPAATGRTIRITNGQFSIPTGLFGLGAKPPKSGNQVVRCRGSAHSCSARVGLAGGAKDREIVIRLPSRHLALQSVKAPPRSRHAAYILAGGHFARGGSEYVVTLNAARSSPRGSHLTLTFAGRR
ncbi:MAG: hypothetical protein ACJ76X_17070 [Solirubrobacteraceae bacterium]